MIGSGRPPSSEPRGEAFRAIPSVDAVLRSLPSNEIDVEPSLLTEIVAESLADVRRRIARGEVLTREAIQQMVRDRMRALAMPRLTRVLNGTGIIIHTNLGRAPVSAATARAMAEAASSAVPLEIEPESNERGGRMREITMLLHALTGAEAALVVNNNAAAVLLVLAALANGREVIVSRGEAVEIGGGFRIPDVMRQSGARLVEVGTTNRTYARDYVEAINLETAAILKVHPSNFRMTGFTASPTTAELVDVGRAAGIPVIEDLGSGALLDTARFGLAHEPTMRDSLDAGASVIMASGDKLLGGPQSGIIAGTRDLVDRIAAHPLARAVRADKACLAGLAATLRHYLSGETEARIPVWRMISAQTSDLKRRAEMLVAALANTSLSVTEVPTLASVGGGSLPGEELPSVGLRLTSPENRVAPEDLARALRTQRPTALFGRVQHDAVMVDLRTILPEDDSDLLKLLVDVANCIAHR